MAELNLNDKRKGISQKVLDLFRYDFEAPLINARQVLEKTDLIYFVLREIEKQDKEFINKLKKDESMGERQGDAIDKLAGFDTNKSEAKDGKL